MPTVAVFDMTGKKTGEMELNAAVFGIEPNMTVVHAAVKNYLANQRQGTQSTLTRAEVRGGGIKPWRQKGTGRARQGSIRSPQWTHGGIALGPKPRSYNYSLTKKTKRLAMLSALSAKAAAGEIIVIDGLDMGEIKTKSFVGFLNAVEATGKSLVVTPEVRVNVVKSAANIPGVRTTIASTLNVYDILNADKFIIDKAGGIRIMKYAYDIIKKPIITERSMMGAQDNKYTFEVAIDAGKVEIKKAVEEIFGVKVAKVNTIKLPGKWKRMGVHVGKRSDIKKAIVTLTADSKKIEIFENMM